jgi:hypothetical protein
MRITVHHYLFLLYAINVASVGAQGLTFNQVMSVIQNDVVGATSIIGTFHLPQQAALRANSKRNASNRAIPPSFFHMREERRDLYIDSVSCIACHCWRDS